MLPFPGYSRKRIFAFNKQIRGFYPISTPLPHNSFIDRLIKSRYTELCVLVFGAGMVFVFWGTDAQGGQGTALLGNGAPYITETAVAYEMPLSRVAVIGDIVGGPDFDSSASLDTIQGESALIAQGPPDTAYLDGFKAYQVVKYTVQSGDTIGDIASNFGVSINTIVWANNLKDPDALSLGQTLNIPPVTGVIHTVQAGDTVAAIAQKYKADSEKIISFNDLSTAQILQAGDELIVPGGELPGPKPVVKSVAKGSGGSGIYVSVGDGQCVAFVQAHGFAGFHGNAYTWKRYINTPVPVVGGVAVLRGGRFGHVALITAVKPDSIQVVEQNYYGPHIIDHREISLNDRSIVGFIQN